MVDLSVVFGIRCLAMPTLHLMIGLPCSGKTTLAKALQVRLGALRLTADEWHEHLFGQDVTHPDHDERHGEVEGLQWQVATWALSNGHDVILDFGMWQRSEREDFRRRAAALGASSVIHFLDVEHDELLERLDRRNAALPEGALRIPRSSLRECIPYFQAPDEDELLPREARQPRPSRTEDRPSRDLSRPACARRTPTVGGTPERRPPCLHLICGLPGTGKTTLARQLEKEHRAIRFCPDEWITEIWTQEHALSEGNSRRDNVEGLQWRVATRALSLGVDAVIEWGTWGRSERERLRDEARALGARVALYYLTADRSTLKERILKRNLAGDPHEFVLGESYLEAHLDEWLCSMQEPSPEELATYDSVSI